MKSLTFVLDFVDLFSWFILRFLPIYCSFLGSHKPEQRPSSLVSYIKSHQLCCVSFCKYLSCCRITRNIPPISFYIVVKGLIKYANYPPTIVFHKKNMFCLYKLEKSNRTIGLLDLFLRSFSVVNSQAKHCKDDDRAAS